MPQPKHEGLEALFSSQGYTVYSIYSPNVLVLQDHAEGMRGHYYTVKAYQSDGDILLIPLLGDAD